MTTARIAPLLLTKGYFPKYPRGINTTLHPLIGTMAKNTSTSKWRILSNSIEMQKEDHEKSAQSFEPFQQFFEKRSRSLVTA